MKQSSTKRRRWLLAGAAVFGLTSLAALPNLASEKQDAYYERTAFCIKLFLTDLVRHTAEGCVDGFVSPGPLSPPTSGSGSGRPVVDNGPPPPDDDCYVWVGGAGNAGYWVNICDNVPA